MNAGDSPHEGEAKQLRPVGPAVGGGVGGGEGDVADGKQLAQPFQLPPQQQVDAAEELDVLHVQQQPPLGCQLHQRPGFGKAEGKRIFNDSVDPCFQRSAGNGPMIPIDGADKNQIQPLLAEERRPVEIGSSPKLGGKSSAPIRRSTGNGHDLHLSIFAQGLRP